MAGVSYIGKPISLISHSDIRYRGILHGIDAAASTISLANVISMGTENRRPAEAYIPPSDVPYEFIIFRASEVKDIAVDQLPPQPSPAARNVHDDPAVMTASMPQALPQVQQYAEPAAQKTVSEQQVYQDTPAPSAQPGPRSAPKQNVHGAAPRQFNGADTGMENVQRAMGELRTTPEGANHNRRGRGGVSTIRAGEMSIPSVEFDFETSNARFDKVHEDSDGDNTNPSEDGEVAEGPAKTPDTEKAYNPKASFFDSLSSGAARPPLAQRENVPQGRGGPGGARGRRGGNRREEERQRNVATFGEPGGGPGLMGPGAYIAGWGSGRRGQGQRGRRGGGPRPVQ